MRTGAGLQRRDDGRKDPLEVEKLVPDAIQALPAHIAALKDILPPKKFSAEAADQYQRLLDDLLAALRTARCDTADGVVWLRFGWGGQGLLGFGSHGHREFVGNPGRLAGRCPERR